MRRSASGSSGGGSTSEEGIAFICHPYHRGGVTRWMLDAAAEFRRRGRRVWFVAPEPSRPFMSGLHRPTMVSLLRDLPLEVRPFLVDPSVGLSFELGTSAYRASVYGRAIRRAIPVGTPCIVSDDPAAWLGVAAVSATHPLVGILHGDDTAYYDLAREYRDRLALCVAVSHRIAGHAAREAGIEHPETIPCGIPIVECSGEAVSNGVARLIWIGRMEEQVKRVRDLPAIAAALRDRGVAFRLDIVGDGEAAGGLRSAIQALQLEQHVHLLGWRDASDIRRLLCASDVLLLPSNKEGMPIVMMEALAAGCSVVASRVSGVEDAVQDPSADGVLFAHEVGQVDEAAMLVGRALYTSAVERRARARRAAKAMFAIDVCVDRYERALAALPVPTEGAAQVSIGPLGSRALAFPLAMARSARRGLRRRVEP